MLCAFRIISQKLVNSHNLSLLSLVKRLDKLLSKYFSFSDRNHTFYQTSKSCHLIKLPKALSGHGLVVGIVSIMRAVLGTVLGNLSNAK